MCPVLINLVFKYTSTTCPLAFPWLVCFITVVWIMSKNVKNYFMQNRILFSGSYMECITCLSYHFKFDLLLTCLFVFFQATEQITKGEWLLLVFCTIYPQHQRKTHLISLPQNKRSVCYACYNTGVVSVDLCCESVWYLVIAGRTLNVWGCYIVVRRGTTQYMQFCLFATRRQLVLSSLLCCWLWRIFF